jgi:bifunctional UDP-N-acetylglucosamine pyrophosphorylase/glucosamine-1-phosphate N-acetyltransferase
MQGGVRLLSPETSFFSHDTVIGKNVIVEQHVVIGRRVRIHDHVTIRAFSHLEDCEIFSRASVGPFARIRGKSELAEGVVIGNFVELKGAIIGSDTKVKHLSYIGDTEIGAGTNVGAGTITCNFDGVQKHRSTIGNNVLVGANSAIVSPVKIGDESTIGAGSVITKDVPSHNLAIARSYQLNKEWRRKKR